MRLYIAELLLHLALVVMPKSHQKTMLATFLYAYATDELAKDNKAIGIY